MAIWKSVRFGQQIFKNLPLFFGNVTASFLLTCNVFTRTMFNLGQLYETSKKVKFAVVNSFLFLDFTS